MSKISFKNEDEDKPFKIYEFWDKSGSKFFIDDDEDIWKDLDQEINQDANQPSSTFSWPPVGSGGLIVRPWLDTEEPTEVSTDLPDFDKIREKLDREFKPWRPSTPVCECGAAKCGHPRHSTWCPKYREEF